ncbi:hypothetical protein EC9_43290 [Rosistilla ulvae]|uniref:Glucose/Sorbosone dehydrogenase domain-containing protein n=2 Tax=Rosistilla ulvae TaxID=1930277 RepID=A0A517M5H2_9BACT|nr:hypothetical protein EC9_43290 [Rosistilla ulvae]
MTSMLLDRSRQFLAIGIVAVGVASLLEPAGANEFFPRFSVENLVQRDSHSTVTIGPDGHLYATTTNSGGRELRDNGEGKMVKEHLGEVWRYQLDSATGHVVGEERLLMLPGPVNGFVFDPSATAENLIFYITVLNDRGHMNRIRVKPVGAADPVIENTIVLDFLGRGGNHGMNNLVFTPSGKMYANQGGRTFWGTTEDNQSAAVLEIDFQHPDFAKGAVSPRDYTLEQMQGGDAPIQLVATGLRNPHGIVQHSNGEYYVTIHDPPRGPLLVGGPIKEEVVSDGPPDLVARLKRGAYYGHANPLRKEWVSYGGNPTAEVDPFEIPEYPVGTMPLPNFDLSLMIGTRRNHCISGIDEYLNGDLVAGYLYAQGAEGVNLAGIERFVLDENGNFTGFHEFLKGEDNQPIVFQGVMDLFVTEQGWIYVANFGRRRGDGGIKGGIELLKPLGGNIPPSVVIKSPENRSVYAADATIDFHIEARDYDGQVSEVVLLVNGKSQKCVHSKTDDSLWGVRWKQPPRGRYEVQARVTDNDGKSVTTQPLFLQVDADAHPPVITEMPATVAFVGADYRATVRADSQSNVRFALRDAPEGMKIDPESGEIVWRANRPGNYAARVIADNGTHPAAERKLQIEALTARPADYPPGPMKGLVAGVEYAAASEDRSAQSGTVSSFELVPPSNAGMVVSGFIQVDEPGVYEFAATKPDSATFTIGTSQVFSGPSSPAGLIPLEAGKHAFTLRIDRSAGSVPCALEMRSPHASSRSPLPKSALFRHAKAYGIDRYHGSEPYLQMPRSERDFLPQKLSETGAFADVRSMTLADGAIPYDVNSPLWSDGAFKQRWVFVPAGMTIDFDPSEPWTFPAGTVFVKHFALGEEQKRIETRLTVVKEDQTIYGATYRWNDSNDDANLVTTGVEEEVQLADGSRQPWFYPGPEDCMTCHTHASGYVLGPNTRQLNRDFHYATTGKSDNQLRSLAHVGLFTAPPKEDAIDDLDRLYPLDDETVPLDRRVRSYLASNCSQCHTTGGVNANWFADYAAELSDLGVLDAKPLNHMGLSNVKLIAPGKPERSVMLLRVTSDKRGYRMPPVGRLKTDDQAVEALTQWIAQLQAEKEEK